MSGNSLHSMQGTGWPSAAEPGTVTRDDAERARRIAAATEFYSEQISRTGPGYRPEAHSPAAVFGLVTAACQDRFGLSVKDVLTARARAYRQWARTQPRTIRLAAEEAADAVLLAVDPPDEFKPRTPGTADVIRKELSGLLPLVATLAAWTAVGRTWVALLAGTLAYIVTAILVAFVGTVAGELIRKRPGKKWWQA